MDDCTTKQAMKAIARKFEVIVIFMVNTYRYIAQHIYLILFFFNAWWHLVAFIFTRSYLFLRGYRAGCMICCFTTHSRQTIDYTSVKTTPILQR